MNDNPAAPIAIWLDSEIMPASAITVTSVNWWAALKALMTGSMVAVSALLPSNAATVSGNPLASVSRPIVICGSRRLGRPGARCPDCSGSFPQAARRTGRASLPASGSPRNLPMGWFKQRVLKGWGSCCPGSGSAEWARPRG